ncbi:aromatic acid exporter family protein [Alkalihalobacillus hemicellulosilyticus]|uniref:Integral membrane protein n=1 Tax=Halalkalibacter hemicellulosilyticusJCM 9152 TaxID=1236971 RepID=W4QF26_9BACI|nr:aromatic acid exporter family protein [Halalkalibacter hemicellulosilyticus]GAE29914.1 integral membrane protein [Halalkalibacter hemicellulosilyticusJCM 9152]
MKGWIGRRVLKTGLSVFITATICHFINIPPTFAVVTAIVTIEPTAADSIKKGLIRLPAAAIGAMFAIFLTMMLGPTPITYGVVSILTIMTCMKLKLDTGTLVATLTAVAMIPATSLDLVSDFAQRITGTSIGIIVSTLINFLILPPQFGPILSNKVNYLFSQTAHCIHAIMDDHFNQNEQNKTLHYRLLQDDLIKAYQFIHFQIDEWVYRRSTELERRSFSYLQKKMDYLHFILFHLGKLAHTRVNHHLSNEDQEVLRRAIDSFSSILKDPYHQVTTEHYICLEQLKQLLNEHKHEDLFVHQVCRELLSLQRVMKDLTQITSDERRVSIEEKSYPSYIFNKPSLTD